MNRENVANELLALERNGLIKPTEAVQWARVHTNSHLHQALEWDDAVAGEAYRVQQVRSLIAVFVEPVHHARQFVSLSVDRVEGGGYRRIEQVMNQQDLRSILLQDALHELERMREKYQALQELDKVWAAAGEVQKKRGRPPGSSANKKTTPTQKR